MNGWQLTYPLSLQRTLVLYLAFSWLCEASEFGVFSDKLKSRLFLFGYILFINSPCPVGISSKDPFSFSAILFTRIIVSL